MMGFTTLLPQKYLKSKAIGMLNKTMWYCIETKG